MDKLTPVIQATPVTTKAAESVSSWYATEAQVGAYTESQVAWLGAQGWNVYASVTSGGKTTSFMNRRIIKAENVLDDLVASYTDAYNEGRQLNDQRYDDLLVLYTAALDKTEDSYNTLETADTAYETLVETILDGIDTDFDAYDTDVTGDLDTWGTDLLAEINARFDAESATAQQALIDRGLYSAALWSASFSPGVEDRRTRALNNANDLIAQRQLELKHKVYAEQISVTSRLLAARDRLRTFLHGAKDKQVAIRNAIVEALARVIEARTDSYPDMAEIGRLAASLGAGSPEAYSA